MVAFLGSHSVRHGEGVDGLIQNVAGLIQDSTNCEPNTMHAASAATGPAPATVPTAVVPTTDEPAAVPVPALPMAEYLDGMAAFYKRCLAAYDARNHEGTSGRKTACDTHRTYAIADLAARCAVRAAWLRERERERRITSG